MSSEERPDRLGSAMRQIVGEQVATAPPAMSWSSVVSAASGHDEEPTGSHGWRRTWIATAAAVACVVALVSVLVVMGRDDALDPSDVPDGPIGFTQVPLSQVESLGSDDWVIPSSLPDGAEFLWATVRSNANVVSMGQEAATPSYVIESTYPASTGPSVAPPTDTAWVMTARDVGWRARRGVGSAIVAVNGPGEFDDAAQALLDALVVVPAGALPEPPVDPSGPMTEVASFVIDGAEYTYGVVGSSEYACTRVGDPDGGSEGACGPFEAAGEVFASFAGGGGYTYTEDADVVRASTHGVVRGDVALVEVEFIDGTTVSVAPMNSSDIFPELRFWVVAADVTIPELQSFENLTPVSELRAFDERGTLLERRRPLEDDG